ncbi:helix-turn-helix transcriptional regulator [Aliidiomarina indica]|uniref:helix-turn-helix transcriptional regulator n=1 Tax=Aliidiomarina indica TaxID=2749147 RepID=UPI00188DF1C9|nr:WYL domain-containing transcriptional regulator [Aliidiomarina indica]
MSAQGTRQTVTRQWELLKQLPSRGPGITSGELTQRLIDEGFAVSKRTVERDLSDLSCLFPIQCNDKSRPFGWYWLRDASVDLPGVSLAEAMSLTLVEETLKPLLPHSVLQAIQPRFELARAKLNSLGTNQKLLNWSKKVAHVPAMLTQLPPEINEEVLDQVQLALLHERCVHIAYHSMGHPEAKTMTLHPLGLVQRGTVTYLIARVEGYDDVRMFALQRISSAQVQEDAPCHPPQSFDLQAYVEQGAFQFSAGKTLVLRVKIYSADVVRLLTESPLSKDQRITNLGEYSTLSATVNDSWQLRWWLLSLAELVEVLEPTTLRKGIAERLQQAAKRYNAARS